VSSPTTLPGGGSTLFPPGWTDQLYRDMKAQGRAKLALVPEWHQGGPKRSPEHLKKMREGLQRYHERRRAALGR
jgi:hypothetical protein